MEEGGRLEGLGGKKSSEIRREYRLEGLEQEEVTEEGR